MHQRLDFRSGAANSCAGGTRVLARYARNIALLLPLVGIAAWVAWRGAEEREDPAAVLVALKAAQGPVLPAAAAAGAASATEVAGYDRETLYEFIDGAADAYLARGFQRCVATTFAFTSPAGEVEVAAEVYRFTDAAGARGQLESERPGAAQPLAGIADAWTDGGVLVAARGPDYLKVTAFSPGADAAKALVAVAEAWSRGETQ